MTATTTVIQLDLWVLILGLFGIASSFGGGIFLFGKFLTKQMDTRLSDRFQLQEETRTEASTLWTRRFELLERENREHREQLLQFRLQVSEEYWRREDAIRQEVVLHAKIDALAAKIDNLALRALRSQPESTT